MRPLQDHMHGFRVTFLWWRREHFSFRSRHREEVLNQSYGSKITTRRSLLQNAALSAAAAMAVPAFGSTGKQGGNAGSSPSSFANLIDRSTFVTVFLEEKNTLQLDRTGDTWEKETCTVDVTPTARGLSLSLVAPFASVLRVHVRWRVALPAAKLRVLSDAWERSYGDLGWREVIPECPLPWYFLTFDGERTHGYGVAVGAAALAFWQCDREGVSLWLDVRNGGKGVKLSERALPMATVVVRAGEEGESPLAAARAFCLLLSPSPKKSVCPIYGSNDWYYAYGNNTPEGILRDAALVAELAPTEGARPFTIVDGGWEDKEEFPDMAGLAEDIRKKGVRPGIWIRPTQPVGESDP
jgi:alpha-galactosidase